MYGSYQTNLFPGAATYTSPIEVPKGTNDLQPFISIQYNSQSVKQRPSILGVGWGLTQNYVYRDINATLANVSDDTFKLVFLGNAYDLVYDSTDSFYHTKTETFLRIGNLSGASNTDDSYWLVKAKDGTQFRFGFTNDSELSKKYYRVANSGWRFKMVLYPDTGTYTWRASDKAPLNPAYKPIEFFLPEGSS